MIAFSLEHAVENDKDAQQKCGCCLCAPHAIKSEQLADRWALVGSNPFVLARR